MPVHTSLDHARPDQARPDHARPDHDFMPPGPVTYPEPVQSRPIQVPPFQSRPGI